MMNNHSTVECENCGKVWELCEADSLECAADLGERLEAGYEVPAGECQGCGCFVYLKHEGAFKELEATINHLTKALEEFVETVDVTGGITLMDACFVPNAAQDWPDLSLAYEAACKALGRPVIVDGPCEG